MIDKAEAAILSTLAAIRARRQVGTYSARDDAAIESAERALAPAAPGFVAQMMRGTLADCPVLVPPELRSASAA